MASCSKRATVADQVRSVRAYARRRAKQSGDRRASTFDLPGSADLRPAAQQEAPDRFFATRDSAGARVVAPRRRGAAARLVRMGDVASRHIVQSLQAG